MAEYSKMSAMKLFLSVKNMEDKKIPIFLKWENTIVGLIKDDLSVDLKIPTSLKDLPPVRIVLQNNNRLTREQFIKFLEERVPSSSRRDIHTILKEAGMSTYNVIELASATRAISSRDLFWLSNSEEERFDTVINSIISSIFQDIRDMKGSPLYSPEGVNIKRYAVSNGVYGLMKKRLHPFSTDIESEVVVYEICKLLGVDCCPAWIVKEGKESLSFSEFKYEFSKEYLVHISRLYPDGLPSSSLYLDLITKLPEFKKQIQQMIVVDFLTRQTDRHTSNMALKISGNDVLFYPLYDSGRSLFFEDTEEFMKSAIKYVEDYSESFGVVGTYYDIILDIHRDTKFSNLINIDVSINNIKNCLKILGNPTRELYALEWFKSSLNILKTLDKKLKNNQVD